MRAMVINDFGDSRVFEEVELARPILKSGEVLIKVAATSVNPLDYKLRLGMMPGLVNFPMVLHGDVSGVIVQISSDVHNFAVGDEVYGCIGGLLDMQGALAEYVAVDSQLISLKPKKLSLIEAAALPLVAETVWEGLVTKCRVQPGQKVLIYGGTGGVGHVAIQLAKILGAQVYATVSEERKGTLAKELGAECIINYKEEPLADYVAKYTQDKGFDVVFDTVGGTNLKTAMQAVANNGAIITIDPHGEYDLTNLFLKNANLYCVMQPLPLITGKNRHYYNEILAKIAEYVDTGKIKPLIDHKIFNLSEVSLAHDYLANGQAIGKVLIAIN